MADRYYPESSVNEMLYDYEHDGIVGCPQDYPYIELPQNNWHTGKPTEEGWYLLKLNHNGEPKYNANYLWDIGFGKEWKYAYLGEVIKWQKIEED